MFDTDLPKLARSLRARNLEARADTYGTQFGLWVGEHFYPLWELNLNENQDAFTRFDFDEIRGRRGPNWTVARPIKPGPQ
jgi:hypothetical protein